MDDVLGACVSGCCKAGDCGMSDDGGTASSSGDGSYSGNSACCWRSAVYASFRALRPASLPSSTAPALDCESRRQRHTRPRLDQRQRLEVRNAGAALGGHGDEGLEEVRLCHA